MRLEHWLYSIPLRVRSLFRRSRVEQELDEELQFQLDQRIAQEIAAGKTAEQARYAALRAMEGLEQRKEECREIHRTSFVDDLQRNLRYAVRALKHNPGFANPATAIELPSPIVPGQELPDPPGRHVAIVKETFVRHFFGDHSTLGRHVVMGGPLRSGRPLEIVGIVKDARYFNLRDAVEPMMFIPVWRRFAEQRTLVIRTASSTALLSGQLRREIHQLDPVIPLLSIRTLEHDVNESVLVERLVATFSGFFGVLTLLLSAVGLYGVVAYRVTRRTREIGIRIAIGAAHDSVLWLIFRDVISMVFIGAVIGIAAAFLANRAIVSILYGVSAKDPLSIAAAGLCLLLAAMVASFLPARRAAKIDPISRMSHGPPRHNGLAQTFQRAGSAHIHDIVRAQFSNENAWAKSPVPSNIERLVRKLVRHNIQDLAQLRTDRFLSDFHAAQLWRCLGFRKNPKLGRSAGPEFHSH